MNNLQLYLAIGIPTITVILAWLSSRADNHRLNDKVDRLAESMRGDMATLRSDMNRDMLSLRTEISKDMVAFRTEINKDFVAFRREMHQDLMMLHERVVKVETKQDM